MESTTFVTTTVTTKESKQRASYFEWYGGKTVFLASSYDVNDDPSEAFTFKNIPTTEQVVTACEAYFS